MNAFLGFSENSVKDPLGTYYYKSADFSRPVVVSVFFDVHEDTITGPSFTAPLHRFDQFPASRHGASGTLSFADGHAEIKRWLDPRTRLKVNYSFQLGGWPAVLPMPNNKDLLWVRERLTEWKSP